MTAPRGPHPAAQQSRLDLQSGTTIADNDLDRLRRYLKVNSLMLIGTMLALVTVEIFLRSRHMAFALVCLTVVLAALLVAWRLTVRNRPASAAQVLALATWLAAFGITAASPFILPVSVLWTLMPIVLPLVLLSHRVARRLLVGTTITEICVVVVGALLPEQLRVEPPMALKAGIVIGSVTVISVVCAYTLSLGFERSIEERELLHDSRKRIISAAYDARRQIERDLHDGAQQRLVSTSVRLALVGRLMHTDPARAEAALAEAAADLKLALQDLRQLAHGIYPPLLMERGLGPALTTATRWTPFPVHVDVVANRLPMNVEATLYFCCLEGVQNAVKHADPTGQWITVEFSDPADRAEQVRFSIRDDGVGFDSTQVFDTVGLMNISDRVEAVGGTVSIESAPGEGTVISGSIPLTERAGETSGFRQ